MRPKTIIKNHVRFKGEFKKEFKDEFPGRDLAEFIAERLRQKNCKGVSVEYEEPWFSVKVMSGSIEYPLMVSQSAMEEDYWEISCPRTLGSFARFRGKSEDAELQNLVNVIDEILQEDNTITDIKWYSDYDDLIDDYTKEPILKYLNIFWKYVEKLFLPVCLTGWILALIGGIHSGKESILLRIGAIMFLLPIAIWFGFFIIKLLVGLIDDIKESFQKKTKKRWFRWILTLLIISLLIVPFFLGLAHNPAIDRVMSIIEKNAFRFCILLIFCGMLFAVCCGLLSVKKLTEKKRKILLVAGSIFLLLGGTGFFGAGLSALDMLKWIPDSIELPLAGVAGIDVNQEGYLFVASKIYCRIQVYDSNGDYVRGWFLNDTYGKDLKISVNEENAVEVASYARKRIDIFDSNGKLLTTKKYNEDDQAFFDAFEQRGKHLFDESTQHRYDAEGWIFPRIIQTGPNGEREIGKNAIYLFPFQGPFQGWTMCFAGILLMGLSEKKKKKKRVSENKC